MYDLSMICKEHINKDIMANKSYPRKIALVVSLTFFDALKTFKFRIVFQEKMRIKTS